MLGDFQQAVEKHKDRIFTFAYYYLGNREQAEDVSQEVLIRLWRHWQELDTDAVPAWLTTVTRNACFDALRKKKRLAEKSTDSEQDDMARIETEHPDPERLARSEELRRRIEAALLQLDEPYRSIVVLREIQERSYREISDALAMPLNTVRVYLHRGRRRLREQLSEVYRNVRA